jgi:Tfp pilus assembly protein PilF
MRRLLATLLLLAPLLGCSSSGTKAKPSAEDRAHAEDPLYSVTLLRQGSALYQQKRYDDALARFQEAQRLAPTNPTTHNMVGYCYLQMGKLELAIAAFDEALKLTPSYTDARGNRGAAYLKLGKYALAESDFLGVLEDSTYPHRAKAYYNLGMAELQQGRLAAAEESFHHAADAPVPESEAFLRLAEIAQKQGRTDAAIGLLEEARIKAPERYEVAVELGRLLLQVGRTAEGRKQLEQVVAADPGSALADQARSLLASH